MPFPPTSQGAAHTGDSTGREGGLYHQILPFRVGQFAEGWAGEGSVCTWMCPSKPLPHPLPPWQEAPNSHGFTCAPSTSLPLPSPPALDPLPSCKNLVRNTFLKKGMRVP